MLAISISSINITPKAIPILIFCFSIGALATFFLLFTVFFFIFVELINNFFSSNGFSGSLKDCCDYYSCGWNGSGCDWEDAGCTYSASFCQGDITLECQSDSDCSGEVGSCAVNKWIENIDPNADNYWSNNACYYEKTS